VKQQIAERPRRELERREPRDERDRQAGHRMIEVHHVLATVLQADDPVAAGELLQQRNLVAELLHRARLSGKLKPENLERHLAARAVEILGQEHA